MSQQTPEGAQDIHGTYSCSSSALEGTSPIPHSLAVHIDPPLVPCSIQYSSRLENKSPRTARAKYPREVHSNAHGSRASIQSLPRELGSAFCA